MFSQCSWRLLHHPNLKCVQLKHELYWRLSHVFRTLTRFLSSPCDKNHSIAFSLVCTITVVGVAFIAEHAA